jgi:exosortase D (VPLPA-CTERM-specific)
MTARPTDGLEGYFPILKPIDKRFWWLPGALVIAVLLFSYRATIEGLFQQLLANEDYSGGLLIVPISVWLAWRKRDELSRLDVGPDWRGLGLMALAIAIFVVGELGAELFTTRVSLIVFLIGAVWLLYGWKAVACLRFALLFLFFILPLPGFIHRNMTFPLQLISSAMSVRLMQLFGYSVYREGNVIDIGFTQLQVVEACNGLRFILPMLTIGVLFAFLNWKPWWQRLVLIAACVPIAVLANIVRIAGTGVIAHIWGVKAAEGFFHDFSGWVVFMACLAVFVVLNFGLDKIPRRPQPQRADAPSGPGVVRLSWLPVTAAVILMAVTPAIVAHMGSVPPVPLKQPLTDFPTRFGDWAGRPSPMEAKIWDQVGGQDYVIIDFENGGQPPVNFYAAYYEYQRKAGDFIHSPKLCLPGAGWFVEQNRVRAIALERPGAAAGKRLVFNEMEIHKNQFHQLVYFWYQGRGRNFTSEYLAKFYMVWDGIFRRRTDGALVRLIRPIGPNESIESARSVLDPFAAFVSMTLGEHLPD